MGIERQEREKAIFDEFLSDKPQIIKDIVRKISPLNRYRLKPTRQHCDIISYFEDGTIKILVNGHDKESLNIWYKNIPVCVFGINPEDLERI